MMNHNQTTGLSNRGRMLRQRPLILAGLIATGIVAAVQYKRMSIARNERAQRNEGGYYVSVDRSGGGI